MSEKVIEFYEVYSTVKGSRTRLEGEAYPTLEKARERVKDAYGTYNVVRIKQRGDTVLSTELVDTLINVY